MRCGALSDIFEQEYGVVRGGVISPQLFTIVIDSLMDVIPHNVSVALYADDCTIWAQGKQFPLVFQKIQIAINRIEQWSEQNEFIFSPAKSNGVSFRRGLKRVDID